MPLAVLNVSAAVRVGREFVLQAEPAEDEVEHRVAAAGLAAGRADALVDGGAEFVGDGERYDDLLLPATAQAPLELGSQGQGAVEGYVAGAGGRRNSEDEAQGGEQAGPARDGFCGRWVHGIWDNAPVVLYDSFTRQVGWCQAPVTPFLGGWLF